MNDGAWMGPVCASEMPAAQFKLAIIRRVGSPPVAADVPHLTVALQLFHDLQVAARFLRPLTEAVERT